MRPKTVLAGILALLVLILVVQNSDVVTVNVLFWSFEVSRVVVILVAAGSGFFCGYVVAKIGSVRARAG